MQCPACGKPVTAVAQGFRVAAVEPQIPLSRDELAMAKTLMALGGGHVASCDGQPTAEARPKSRWLAFFDRIDRHVAGRRLEAAGVAVLVAAVGGPLVDRILAHQRPIATSLATDLLLVVFWALCFAWLVAQRDTDGEWNAHRIGRRLKASWNGFVENCADLTRLEPTQRWARLGRYGVGLGCVLLLLQNLATLGAVLLGANAIQPLRELYLAWIGTACCLLGAWPVLRTPRRAKVTLLEQATLARRSIEELPAILELERMSEHPIGQSDPLRMVLLALSKWSARRTRCYDDDYAYREALVRHLRQHASQLECRRELWLGKKRSDGIADLMLDRLVLVKVCRGFDQTTAERTVGELARLAQTWRGKPKLLVLFEVERRELLNSVAMPILQSLHQASELVTVRM